MNGSESSTGTLNADATLESGRKLEYVPDFTARNA